MRNVLILAPAPNARGGITNYYSTLRKYFVKNIYYQYRGSRTYPFKKGMFAEITRLFADYLIFFKNIFKYKISLIQTSTSFDRNAVLRDAVFIFLAKVLKKKIVVFYRGWDQKFESQAIKNPLFKCLFLRTDASIVLSKFQKDRLSSWNHKNAIYVESTVVDDTIASAISKSFIEIKYSSLNRESKITILFLARLEKTKGIFDLLEAYALLKKNYNIELIISGDGTAEKDVKAFIVDKKLDDVKLTGFVSGTAKFNIFKKSHLYILPSYSEGMPNGVLEAMVFGLPVIATPVGGLVDFFENDIHGKFIKKRNAQSIVIAFERLVSSNLFMKTIGLNNHEFAVKNFLASKTAKRNEEIFSKVLNN